MEEIIMKKLTIFLFTSLICITATAQWEWQNPLPHGNSLSDVDFINEYEGWAAGGQVIMHTLDGGNTWDSQYRDGDEECA